MTSARGRSVESSPSAKAKVVLRLGETKVAEFKIGNGESTGGTDAVRGSFQELDRIEESTGRSADGWDERPPQRWGLNE